MRVTCQSCRKRFTAQRSTARYCSGKCAKREQRAEAAATASQTAKATAGPVGRVGAAVEADLDAAGVLGTPAGAQAMQLARRLDLSAGDTGSAMAAVSRELSKVLEEAKRKTGAQVNPVDEFTKRREARRGAA